MQKSMKRYFPIFALPTLVAFTIGFIIPFIMGIYLSFCDFTTISNAKFVGLQNYARIFRTMLSSTATNNARMAQRPSGHCL